MKANTQGRNMYLYVLICVKIYSCVLTIYLIYFSDYIIDQHKGDDSSQSYRVISLTTVSCKQPEHIIAGYLRQVWDKNDWLCEGQHGFRPGYSCESQVITVCQERADPLYKWVSIRGL